MTIIFNKTIPNLKNNNLTNRTYIVDKLNRIYSEGVGFYLWRWYYDVSAIFESSCNFYNNM